MTRSDNPPTHSPKSRRPTAALIVASLALVVAAAPPAYAALKANSVGTRQIKNHSVANADIGYSAVGSGSVANGSLSIFDLADHARWRKTSTGSWDDNLGVVAPVSVFPTVTGQGSLSNDGTGALRLTRASRILVNGSVLAQNQSGATRKIDCNVVIGDTTMYPDATALVLNGSSTTLAMSASRSLNPGTYDVSVNCYAASAGMTAGNTHVNVVAVPLN